jgi:chromosome segregation ATPase
MEGKGEGAAAPDLQSQFDALHQEMEQRATEAEQRRIDLEAQLQQTQATIEALSQQLTDAANQQVEALKRAVIAENADQVIPELVRGDTPEEIESSVALARAAYQRLAQDLRAQAAAQVPTGASPMAAEPIEELSPLAKITAALSRGGGNR